MSLLMHISDPHFGTERPAVAEALLALARAARPDVLVLSGDITQRARRAQFRAARAFVDRLGVERLLALPGNHDIPLFNVLGRFLAPYAGYARAFGHELEPELELEDLLVIGVNTTRRYRHVDGEVSAAQIERVAARLQAARATQLRVIVTHQPMHVTRPVDRKNLLRGHEAAARAWARAGADLALAGHIHLPYVRPMSEHLAGLAHELWAVNAGTALSWRVRHDASNSVNLVRHERAAGPASCSVERWDYEAAVGQFRQASVTPIALEH